MVLYPRVMQKFYSGIEITMRQAGLIAGKSGRHMKYPYTISAKIAQFPFFFYMKYNNIWMYYPVGWAIGLYLFTKIHAVMNSEANVRNWAETRRKSAEKEHH